MAVWTFLPGVPILHQYRAVEYPTTRSYRSFRQSAGLGRSSTVYYLLIDNWWTKICTGWQRQYHAISYIHHIYLSIYIYVHHISHKGIRIYTVLKTFPKKKSPAVKHPFFFQPPQPVKEKHSRWSVCKPSTPSPVENTGEFRGHATSLHSGNFKRDRFIEWVRKPTTGTPGCCPRGFFLFKHGIC